MSKKRWSYIYAMERQQKYPKETVAREDFDSVCLDVMELIFFSTRSVLFSN